MQKSTPAVSCGLRQAFAVVLKEGKTMSGILLVKETLAGSYSIDISHVPMGISGLGAK